MTKHNMKHAMTLRLDLHLHEDLESVAFDLRMSKVDFVRRSIRRAIDHAKAHELPLLNEHVRDALSRG